MVAKILLRASPLAIAVFLCGCGGSSTGSGINSTPAATPAAPTPPPPSTPPPPPPTTVNYDTAEYKLSNGATSINAITAYSAGATGAGINVGVIDSGINASLAEFAERISPASYSPSGNSNYDDEGGHGTAVAAVIAANKNDVRAHGVAFNSTLVVLRADRTGSCATTGEDAGCAFSESAIAEGIDAARVAGAKVINISLGGPDAIGATLRQAVSKATAAGIIIVVSAGNDGEETTGGDPDGFSSSMVSAGQRGLVIVSGALAADNTTIASFSNRAGSTAAANAYITALGSGVLAISNDGLYYRWSGTSFSAPITTGAIALLLQAFPNLTPEQVVQIIYSSARDLGTVGIDSTYGRGGLDLTKAFQPIGAKSLAGSAVSFDPADDGILGDPMGDGGDVGPLSTVMVDSFDRAFNINVGTTFRAAQPIPTLATLMAPQGLRTTLATGQTTLSFAVGPQGVQSGAYIGLHPLETAKARASYGILATKVGQNMDLAIGISQSANNLISRHETVPTGKFLITNSATRQIGFRHSSNAAMALGYKIGTTQVIFGAEQGDVFGASKEGLYPLRRRPDRFDYNTLSLSASRTAGPIDLSLGASMLDERRTILGSRLSPIFGTKGAQSWFIDGSARSNIGGGWTVGIAARHGWTISRASAALTGGTLTTRSWSVDLVKFGLFGANDHIGLRYAEPLRVNGGALRLALPTGYDYATEQVTYGTQSLVLRPNGRARDWELAYVSPFWGGQFSANGYYRIDRANVEWMPRDAGLLLSFSRAF